jgi:hypothetical protein
MNIAATIYHFRHRRCAAAIISSRNILLVCTVTFLCFAAACSIPNLEPAECIASRETVKKFYSFHFGNDMKLSPENIKLREKFLTPDLYASLSAMPPSDTDPFTGTAEFPKAFSIGGCKGLPDDSAVFTVNLFWRDDTRSEQRELKVETKKVGDNWLINKVYGN